MSRQGEESRSFWCKYLLLMDKIMDQVEIFKHPIYTQHYSSQQVHLFSTNMRRMGPWNIYLHERPKFMVFMRVYLYHTPWIQKGFQNFGQPWLVFANEFSDRHGPAARAKWSKGDRMLLDDFLKAGCGGWRPPPMEGSNETYLPRTWMFSSLKKMATLDTFCGEGKMTGQWLFDGNACFVGKIPSKIKHKRSGELWVPCL